MNQTEIDELRRLHEAATPGPWRWRINRQGRVAEIESPKEGGWTVMGFERWGMDGACPSFRMEQNGHSLLTRADQMAVDIPGREHHREWFQGIDSVDANLMTAARNALPRLLAALEEARAERDNALHSMRVAEQCAGMANAAKDKSMARENTMFSELRKMLGQDLGGGGGFIEILNGIEGLQEERDALKAKLAAGGDWTGNSEPIQEI